MRLSGKASLELEVDTGPPRRRSTESASSSFPDRKSAGEKEPRSGGSAAAVVARAGAGVLDRAAAHVVACQPLDPPGGDALGAGGLALQRVRAPAEALGLHLVHH